METSEGMEDVFFQQLAYACTEAKQTFAQYIGMSQARWQLLALLMRKGEVSHAALQQDLSLDGATVTRLVKQFEAEGIASRRLDPQNNRYTLVSLTPAGEQAVAGIRATHSVFQTQLLEGITLEEREVVVRVLERLRANIRVNQAETQQQE